MLTTLAVASALCLTHPLAGKQAVDSTWFHQQSTKYDLTADGRSDTLILTATGSRVDSLIITFSVRSAGRLVYQDKWLSTYYFQYDGPIESIPDSVKHARVFNQLHDFLAADGFVPLDTTNTTDGGVDSPYDTMVFGVAFESARDSLLRLGLPEDSARSLAIRFAWQAKPDSALMGRAWRAILRSRPLTFTYFSGGESIQTIAWSTVLKRFVVVYACC